MPVGLAGVKGTLETRGEAPLGLGKEETDLQSGQSPPVRLSLFQNLFTQSYRLIFPNAELFDYYAAQLILHFYARNVLRMRRYFSQLYISVRRFFFAQLRARCNVYTLRIIMAVRVPDPFSAVSPPPLWTGGPPIGGLYRFPSAPSTKAAPVKHTR